MLDLGASIYAVDIRKWTALHYASYNGRNLVVRLLCKYDDDNNKLRQMKNSQGRIPKEIVAKEKVKLYFDSITRSNLALWESSRTGKLDTVRRLVISGDNVDMQTIKKAYTPLMLAAKYQHLLVVKYLIEHGANPHLKDSGSRT